MSASIFDTVPFLAAAQAKNGDELAQIRMILLNEEWARLKKLELDTAELSKLASEISENIAFMKNAYQQLGVAHVGQKKLLQQNVDQLEVKIAKQKAYFNQRLEQEFAMLFGKAAHEHPEKITQALGPILGKAIHYQIENEKESLVKALSPIILQSVRQAISDFMRDLQNRIDSQIRAASRPDKIVSSFWARIRGIEPSEMILRDALPFAVDELFLIQPNSGLLMGHWSKEIDEEDDSGLISGMLTAVRDFVKDSFLPDGDSFGLQEIQYGNHRILLHNGVKVYLAAVITGTHPQKFRRVCQNFITNLHLRFDQRFEKNQVNDELFKALSHELETLALTLELDDKHQTKKNA
ncbi:MAG: hypothetical protein AAF490_10465 [Chloroflexota bacterium]